jgi:hypothetical protein
VHAQSSSSPNSYNSSLPSKIKKIRLFSEKIIPILEAGKASLSHKKQLSIRKAAK